MLEQEGNKRSKYQRARLKMLAQTLKPTAFDGAPVPVLNCSVPLSLLQLMALPLQSRHQKRRVRWPTSG